MGDGDRHHDDGYAGIGRIEHRADPAGKTHRGVDDKAEHRNDCHGTQQGTQEKSRGQNDDQEHDRREGFHIVPGRVGEGPVQGNVAGQVVGNIGIGSPLTVQLRIEVVGDLDDRGIRIVGERKADCQPCHLTVAGDQTANELRLA